MGGKKDNKKFGLSSGKVGAIAELMVSIDLAKRGYEVFRALSQSCGCDLVGIKSGKIILFEVRTGNYKAKSSEIFNEYKNEIKNISRLSYPKNHTKVNQFAIVTFIDEKIHYEPKLED